MLKYLLDTNIVICTLKNRPQQVKRRFQDHHGRMGIYACGGLYGLPMKQVQEMWMEHGLLLSLQTTLIDEVSVWRKYGFTVATPSS